MEFKSLPHLDLVDHYQFITFRTADSTDEFLRKLALENKSDRDKQMEVNEYLDISMHGGYLHHDVLVYLNVFFKENDKYLYELTAYAIMPNHVHLLVKPLLPLSVMMQKIKGMSSRTINDLLETDGTFWAKNYYDKAIRDDEHFAVVYEYIKNNPLKFGTVSSPFSRFYGIYEE